MVSWGPNTTYSFDKTSTPASTGASLGGASPAPSFSGFSFASSTPAPSFGAPQSNFGGTISSAPASSALAFSSSPAPNTAFPSFATPTTSSSAPSSFTPSWTQQQQQQPASAAQTQPYVGFSSHSSAALQASMHQETTRLEANLLQLQTAYSPYLTAPTQFHSAYPMVGTSLPINTQCRFQHVFYDPITPQHQMERLHHYSSRHPNVSKEDAISLLHTPKPTHFDTLTWTKAQAMNPSSSEFIPVLLSGAEALHGRLVHQQSKVELYDTYLSQLSCTIEQLDQAAQASQQKLDMVLKEQTVVLKKRLLDILRKVEICRARNIPTTTEERKALQRVSELVKQVETLDRYIFGQELEDKVYGYLRMQAVLERSSSMESRGRIGVALSQEEYKNHVYNLLQVQRQGIDALKKTVKVDSRDLQIIRNGLSS